MNCLGQNHNNNNDIDLFVQYTLGYMKNRYVKKIVYYAGYVTL